MWSIYREEAEKSDDAVKDTEGDAGGILVFVGHHNLLIVCSH